MTKIKECIFCKIISGDAPVSKIYEDDEVLVFPTLQPVNPGHLLIIPKRHVPFFADLDENTAMHIMKTAKKLTSAIRKSGFRCEGVNLFVADGDAAGQEIMHFHMHVYPRFKGDEFGFKYNLKKHFIEMDRPELDKIAMKIKKFI
jgi:histidine triad (HIT) family protein